ncbi:MAG TPA: ECF transporter S component [Clostridia bacterium]
MNGVLFVDRARINFITRTALFIALTVVFQFIGRSIPGEVGSFITGPLVNCCIFVSTALLGVWGGVIVSVLAPFSSIINNHAPIAGILILFTPFIAVGNAILAVCFNWLNKKNVYLSVVAASALKFAFLAASINMFIKINTQKDVQEFTGKLVRLFTWPQLLTALVGGFIAIAVIKRLEKAWQNNR